jgi:hypothetical protein
VQKNLPKIVQLPKERKIWILRRFYAGNGGCIPPNDPRILSMTDEQIDLEYQHIALDKKLKDGGNFFEDDEYDDYDRETEEEDKRLSGLDSNSEEDYSNTVRAQGNEGEWEDVEIDDEDY